MVGHYGKRCVQDIDKQLKEKVDNKELKLTRFTGEIYNIIELEII